MVLSGVAELRSELELQMDVKTNWVVQYQRPLATA